MARIRYLKPDFFRDEDLAKLSFEYRLLYAGLWCYADKEGRLQDRPKRLKVDIFPYDPIDIEEGLKELAKPKENSNRPFILRYEADEEKYIQILRWDKHQKPHHTERESEIPPAPPYRNGKGNGDGKDKPARSELDVKDTLDNRDLTVKKQPDPDLQSIMDYAAEHGFSLQGSYKQNRLSAYNLLRKKDPDGNTLGVERVKQLIDIAIACRGEKFAPMINDFVNLYKKWQDLLAFVAKKQKGGRIG